MITTDVVKHIAKLSRLEFSDSEIELLAEAVRGISGVK